MNRAGALTAELSVRRATETDCPVMAEMRLSLFIDERGLPEKAAQPAVFAARITEHGETTYLRLAVQRKEATDKLVWALGKTLADLEMESRAA